MRFCYVKRPPETLGKDEYFIDKPNFMLEIDMCKSKKSRSGLMTANYLRELIQLIGSKYIGLDFNAMTLINATNYIGISCTTEEEIHATIIKLFNDQLPQVLTAYVEYFIKRRPLGTKLIYFIGGPGQAEAFMTMGCEQVLEKELVSEAKKAAKGNKKTDD